LHERDLELVLQVGATTRPRAAAASATGAGEIAEQVADDIFDTDGEVATARPAALLERGVPKAVVLRAALRVGKDLVGLIDLLEPLLGLAVRILVGVILERELPVRSLEIVVVAGTRDAQHFIEVALHR